MKIADDIKKRFPNILPNQINQLKYLDEWDFRFIENKLVEDETIMKNDIDDAIREFKKFMAIRILTNEPLAMTSQKVDQVWHQFILFTRKYHNFCDSIFGEYIHHKPTDIQSPINKKQVNNFISDYNTYYGEIPEIWSVTIDSKGRIHYKADCSDCVEE